MVKKKRQRKITKSFSIEGMLEADFFDYVRPLYADEQKINFYINSKTGGSGDRILSLAIKDSHVYDYAIAWIDEDLDLSAESRKSLVRPWNLNSEDSKKILLCPLGEIQSKFNPENRNPVLIVSQPVCVESLILSTLGKKLPYCKYDSNQRAGQIKKLKKDWGDFLGSQKPLEYFRENLSKPILEERRKELRELDLLIQMIEK